jgi:copper(I)-binding protein
MKKIFIALIIAASLLAACTPATKSDATVIQNGIEISQVKVLLPGGNSMGGMNMDSSLAAFMQIKNTSSSDDQLAGVSADFADASLHETKMDGTTMSMNEISSIDLPAGGTVELKSGGYHIMLMNPKKNMMVGDTVTLTLEFKNAGKISINAKVTDQ